MTPILGIMASGKSGNLALPSGFYSLATYTCTGNTDTTITFSSIPTGYTHLQLRAFARGNGATSNTVAFNNDSSGPNYPIQTYTGFFGTTTYGAQTGNQLPYMVFSTNATADTFAANIIDIPEYLNTSKVKTIKAIKGYNTGATGSAYVHTAYWNNTAAINRIDITTYAGAFQQYSHFALYGIL